MVWPPHNLVKRKERERKYKETNANTPAHRRKQRWFSIVAPSGEVPLLPTTLNRRMPSNTFNKEVTMTSLLPGLILRFPPVRKGDWVGVQPDDLQEGKTAPACVTTLTPNKPTWISPDHRNDRPNDSECST
jgi:hypothetical protein